MSHYEELIEFEKNSMIKSIIWGIAVSLGVVMIPFVISFILYSLGFRSLGIAALFLMFLGVLPIFMWARRLNAKEKSQKKPLIEAWARAHRLDPNGELPEVFDQKSQQFRQGDNMYLLEQTENGPVLTRFAKIELVIPDESIPERPVVKESVNDALWKAAREGVVEEDSATVE